MASVIHAWQCIGCGKIEAPQTCVGICQDRKVKLVDAHEHEVELKTVRDALLGFEVLVRQLAYSKPRNGEWEQAYSALQQRARSMLGEKSSIAVDTTQSTGKPE